VNILLDTHVFLWYVTGDQRIKPAPLLTLRDPANLLLLSVVSLWEASIKWQSGKLQLPTSPAAYLPNQRQIHAIAPLTLEEADSLLLESLPIIHRDPFDRMLVCQAIQHDIPIATADPLLFRYPSRTIDVTR
jgi:PIN domain nuclease of toxin-antitoxin system